MLNAVQVMREADITASGALIGGGYISYLRYADDTAVCSKSPQEINNFVHEVNYTGRIITLNAGKTKLMVVGDEKAKIHIDVDGVTTDKGPIL